jgi:hypothetical protein
MVVIPGCASFSVDNTSRASVTLLAAAAAGYQQDAAQRLASSGWRRNAGRRDSRRNVLSMAHPTNRDNSAPTR